MTCSSLMTFWELFHFLQTLSDDFRLNYCGLWQSILKADIESIKHYSGQLGVGRLFPLFACIITARSWNAVSAGVDKHTFTEEEVRTTLFMGHFLVLANFLFILFRIMRSKRVLPSIYLRYQRSLTMYLVKCCLYWRRMTYCAALSQHWELAQMRVLFSLCPNAVSEL